MLRLGLSQHLSMQQRMAPQLIQSLQLLQMSTLDLALEIKQQMEINPLLEDPLDAVEDEETQADEEAPSDSLEEEAEVPESMDEVDWDALLDDQFDSSSYNNEVSEYDPNWEQDREPQQNRITTMPPLMEQLHEQLTLSDLAGTDVEIAEFIIGNIDDRGYLTCSAEEVSEALGSPLEDVERNLKVIQGFDPVGVGARGLQECLSHTAHFAGRAGSRRRPSGYPLSLGRPDETAVLTHHQGAGDHERRSQGGGRGD